MSWASAIAKARASLNMPPAPTGRLWGRGASEITPRLYLSDLWTACDANQMERLGITHIVSVIEHRPALPDRVPIGRRLQIFLADRGDSNILVYFAESTKFIADALAENENNKVLVHCQQGISRSATIVCAYLCATQGMDAVEAVEYAQSKRSIVCPNAGFRLQLAQYSRQFMKDKRSPKTATVSNDIASRIRSLFPERAAKVKSRTKVKTMAVEEEEAVAVAVVATADPS